MAPPRLLLVLFVFFWCCVIVAVSVRGCAGVGHLCVWCLQLISDVQCLCSWVASALVVFWVAWSCQFFVSLFLVSLRIFVFLLLLSVT